MFNIGNRVKQFIYYLTLQERSPRKLALSCCLGTYIAFSPYIGFHTIMIFFFSWLFRLNYVATFTSSYAINNPWTMFPLYAVDNIFGNWILYTFFSVESHLSNPSWLTWLNEKLSYYIGLSGISLWGFIIGGNLLGVILSVILYPVLLVIFRTFMKSNQQVYQ